MYCLCVLKALKYLFRVCVYVYKSYVVRRVLQKRALVSNRKIYARARAYYTKVVFNWISPLYYIILYIHTYIRRTNYVFVFSPKKKKPPSTKDARESANVSSTATRSVLIDSTGAFSWEYIVVVVVAILAVCLLYIRIYIYINSVRET